MAEQVDRKQLNEDILTLKLELQKSLLEKAKGYAASGSTVSLNSCVKAYVMLETNKLPGIEIVAPK